MKEETNDTNLSTKVSENTSSDEHKTDNIDDRASSKSS
jgi:hypothetical protein